MVIAMALHRALGRMILSGEHAALRARIRARALLIGGAFRDFGPGAGLHPSVRVTQAGRIAVGAGVWVGAGSWLHVVGERSGDVAIEVGTGSSLAGNCTIAAAQRVSLGREVLVARGVYISDHSHAFDMPGVAILAQGIDRVAPVEIGDGAWLAENAVICPGVSIGAGAVVGANSVVTHDVPARTVVVGAPARVVRELDGDPRRIAA
jgi:carbonic anhydrase/acetyltransferase-like protein (isoleucine patch superfamily)